MQFVVQPNILTTRLIDTVINSLVCIGVHCSEYHFLFIIPAILLIPNQMLTYTVQSNKNKYHYFLDVIVVISYNNGGIRQLHDGLVSCTQLANHTLRNALAQLGGDREATAPGARNIAILKNTASVYPQNRVNNKQSE